MKAIKSLLAPAFLLLALLIPGAAWADSVTYDFTGTLATAFNGNSTVTGQFTIDFLTSPFGSNTVTAFDFITPFSDVNASSYNAYSVSENGYVTLVILGSNPSIDAMLLVFQAPPAFTSASLVTGSLPSAIAGYVPSDMGASEVKCYSYFSSGTCPNAQGSSLFSSGFAIDPAPAGQAVPEPSSLLLLGAGLGALLPTFRRNRSRNLAS